MPRVVPPPPQLRGDVGRGLEVSLRDVLQDGLVHLSCCKQLFQQSILCLKALQLREMSSIHLAVLLLPRIPSRHRNANLSSNDLDGLPAGDLFPAFSEQFDDLLGCVTLLLRYLILWVGPSLSFRADQFSGTHPLDRQRWQTRDDLRHAIIVWIERTYNRRRRQRVLGKLTPVEYEAVNRVQQAA